MSLNNILKYLKNDFMEKVKVCLGSKKTINAIETTSENNILNGEINILIITIIII